MKMWFQGPERVGRLANFQIFPRKGAALLLFGFCCVQAHVTYYVTGNQFRLSLLSICYWL